MALNRAPGREPGQRPPPTPQSATARGWGALNEADTRLSVNDDELAFIENGIWQGRSIQAVPLYNGPPGASLNPAISQIKESLGVQLTFASNTIPHPVVIAVFEDGSAWQRDLYLDGAVDVNICPAGTFSSSPGQTDITIWRDGPVLFIDEKAGYCSWNGSSFAVIDSAKKGRHLAVFEGHVWLLTGPRTIQYTEPSSYTGFNPTAGAGAFNITDESFQGEVFQMRSTVEQLWIFGATAVDALGNVQTSGGITTFSVTNAVSSLGSAYADSVVGYVRALSFYTGYSIHALLGVTPQKLSSKIDRLFAFLTPAIVAGPRGGVCKLNGQIVLAYLFQLNDPITRTPRSELIAYVEGKWFLTRTPDLGGHRVLDMVSVTVGTAPELYGIDAAACVYRIFARPPDPGQGNMVVQSKLFDLGGPVLGHQSTRYGFDLSAPPETDTVPVTVALTSEAKTTVLPTFIERFLPYVADPLGKRFGLIRRDAPMTGQRIGWRLSVPCASYVALEAGHLEWAPTEVWDTVDPGASSAGTQCVVFWGETAPAPMARVQVGRFTKGTGPTQVVTGIPFKPVVLILMCARNVAVGTNENGADLLMGFSTGPTKSRAYGMASDSVSSFSVTRQRAANKILSLIHGISGGANPIVDAEADLVSFDTNGFTLGWSTQDSTTFQIDYVAIGDPVQAEIVDWVRKTSPGLQPVTGVPFKPDALLTLGVDGTGALPFTAVEGNLLVAAAAAAGAPAWAAYTHDYDGQIGFTAARCVEATNAADLEAGGGAGSTVMLSRASLASLDPNGFTVNYALSSGTASRRSTLCLKGNGLPFESGSFVHSSGPAPAMQTVGLANGALTPAMVLMATTHQTPVDVVTAAHQLGVGATDVNRVSATVAANKDGSSSSGFPGWKATYDAALLDLKPVNPVPTGTSLAAVASVGPGMFGLNWNPNATGLTGPIMHLVMGYPPAAAALAAIPGPFQTADGVSSCWMAA